MRGEARFHYTLNTTRRVLLLSNVEMSWPVGKKNVKQVTNIIFFLQVLTSERNDCVPRYEAIHPINYKMLLRVHSVQ